MLFISLSTVGSAALTHEDFETVREQYSRVTVRERNAYAVAALPTGQF